MTFIMVTFRIMTLSITAFTITTFRIMTLSIATFSIRTVSTMRFSIVIVLAKMTANSAKITML
jgi:hypothetical protein